jgi:DNA-binding transcriptional MerR regulator
MSQGDVFHSDGSITEIRFTLTVAAVARRLGVAPATLRTWDRRYGITPTDRTSGGHRRYTPEDVALLDRMRRLVIQGLPPAEAARCAHLGNESAGLQMNVAAPAGGGNVVPLPGSTATARGLARAATSMDSNGMTQIVSEAIAERGTIWTWEQVISPVLIGLGKRWEMTGEGIELEHLLTESLKGCFKEVTSRLKTPVNSRAVLLSCAPEELHSLGTLVLSAALAERRILARVLGPRVPTSALLAASKRTGPAVVLVWAQLKDSAGASEVVEVLASHPTALVIAAGPGWQADLPARVVRTQDMTDALTKISTAVGF